MHHFMFLATKDPADNGVKRYVALHHAYKSQIWQIIGWPDEAEGIPHVQSPRDYGCQQGRFDSRLKSKHIVHLLVDFAGCLFLLIPEHDNVGEAYEGHQHEV